MASALPLPDDAVLASVTTKKRKTTLDMVDPKLLEARNKKATANALLSANNTLLAADGQHVEEEERWFSTLPADAFTEEEEQMRDAILQFLAAWTKKEMATLAQVENDEGVRSASSKLLPQAVPLNSWIERRIGGEIKTRPVENGQRIIEIVSDEAGNEVKKRCQEIRAAAKQAALKQRAASQQAAADPSKFLDTLPEDRLTDEELNLRQALLDFLDTWFKRSPNGPPPLLNELMANSAVSRCKVALLPKSVFIKDWVERRIGGEIHTHRLEGGQIHFFCDRHWSPPKERAAGPAKASQSKGVVKRATVETAPPQTERQSSQAFFQSLPSDSFRDDEEKLREALLAFLDHFQGVGPPKLSAAGMDKNVQRLAQSLLPRGSGLPVLKEWIDKRIGGEVETRDLADGNGVVLAMRGKLDELLERARRRGGPSPGTPAGGPGLKRKAEVLGSAAGGCQKGKGSGKQAKKGGSTSYLRS
mmetsp:Transcript_161983/g.311087  ORF Transcript_161983/g.311087 Transcript_161983/m.311087 type:complete len:475 (-) Transcript_161983:89-1513(-)